jgi:hypothetical protein
MSDHYLLTACLCGHTAHAHTATAVRTRCLCTDFLPDRHDYPIGACITS